MRYFKLIILLIILFPFSVNASLCDYSQRVRLQKLAQNITYSYDYIESNGNVTFTFTFNNLNSELYLIDDRNNSRRFDYSGEELVLGGYSAGTSYKFEVRSSSIYCDGSAIYHIYINTPPYNPYYNDPICKDLDYKYCNKWQQNNMTYEEFIKNIEDYKKSLIENDDDQDKIKGIFDYIIEFYANYYFIILPSIIIVCILSIVIYNKKNDLF